MAYNKKSHLETNIEAIRIAFTLDREQRRATDSEIAVSKQYSGFDGILYAARSCQCYFGDIENRFIFNFQKIIIVFNWSQQKIYVFL